MQNILFEKKTIPSTFKLKKIINNLIDDDENSTGQDHTHLQNLYMTIAFSMPIELQ